MMKRKPTNTLPYYDKLYAFAFSYMKQRQDIVEDIVQETYINCYEKYNMPLDLISEDILIDICKIKCKNAYKEMNKNPSNPMRAIEDLGTDEYLDLVNYKNAVYLDVDLDIDLKEMGIIGNNEGIGLQDALNKISELRKETDTTQKKQGIRFSNKFIFEQLRNQWGQKRKKYLDSLINNGIDFRKESQVTTKSIDYVDFMFNKRFGLDVTCPYCGSNSIHTKKYCRKHEGYACVKCRKSFSLYTGTIFSNCKLPLPIWFALICEYVENAYEKISPYSFGKRHGVNQKTCWRICNRLYENVFKVTEDTFCINGFKNNISINELSIFLGNIYSFKNVNSKTESKNNGVLGKQVCCVNEEGESKYFKSILSASRELGLDSRRIGECCNGKRGKYNGFTFVFSASKAIISDTYPDY